MSAVMHARHMSKTFTERTVLDQVDLEVEAGEIHGLLGQNGSGKSTLIKILSGYHHPDPGSELYVRGARVSLPVRPGGARKLGMSFVHQDLALIGQASVLENLRIGRYETGLGWRISWRSERAALRRTLDRFELDIGLDTPAGALREVDRALIAILRALEELRGRENGLLVLDEPTAYLPRDGVDRLFAATREVAGMGFGVLFVSHRLDEVRAITDRVSVLRDGKLVGTTATAAATQDEIVELILGFALENLYPSLPEAHESPIQLSIEGLVGDTVTELGLDIHAGEIVGVTGLIGMGYEEVPYLLFGAKRAKNGVVRVDGRSFPAPALTPRRAMSAGLALLPADRLRDSGIQGVAVADNVTLPTVRRHFSSGFLRRSRELRRVHELLRDFHVQPPEPTRILSRFSGGNQQKALIAKWFETKAKVFLLHEPTQGVDVGARKQIFRAIRDEAARGASFLIASSEYEDLANLCDRVVVMTDGLAVAELHGANLTHERVVERCFRRETTIDHHRSETVAVWPMTLGEETA